jgi:outer membrane immunogenic protein
LIANVVPSNRGFKDLESTEAWDMKRALTLGIGILALASMALPTAAADLGARPIGKAPVMAPPILGWSGFYAGVGLGARALESDWDTTSIGNPPGAPFLFSTPGVFDTTDFRVSGYAGYNWQFATWLLGIEGDIGWADNKATRAGIPGTFGPGGFGPGPLAATLALDSSQVKADWDASIRGRVGILAGPSVLLYATGGAAWLNVDASANCTGSPVNASWCVAVRGQTDSSTRFGWTAGAGIEWMFAPSWIARGEYRYSDYGSFDTTFFGATVDQVNASIDLRTHTAYFGISYLFR